MTSVPKLIDYFTPEHYDLKIDLNESEHTYSGTVSVRGRANISGQPVKLHAKHLTITKATIDGQSVEFVPGELDELALGSNISVGEHTATVEFNAKITDQMHGIYPCYFEHDGVKKELIATQFESHYAREAFPCIDEPGAKARFDVHLSTTPNQTVLSNMPIDEQSVVDGKLVTHFQTTPRMSTYLVAFVVGELHRKTSRTNSGVEVNVWATPAQTAESLDFALETAVKVIEFYDDYFGTSYPLPKSDHVALPDFTVGAMENWGLITYREVALLADPKIVSVSGRHYIATVIAHELAHQWFGNLVTMSWWNDLWLNESFATLMEYISIDAIHPEWNIWQSFITNESIAALRRDCIDGVQSVQVDVNHPDEISTLFDGAIVYAKGCRLLRMIQYYIGNESFKAGLKHYFAEHAYKNTVGNDLWVELSDASGKDIAAIMNTWISQSGYPVVNVTREGDNVTLSQQQFFVGPHEASEKLWPIPLESSSDIVPKLLNSKSVSFTSNEPLQLNEADSAHFITHYDDTSRQHLISRIQDGSLDAVGRTQLLDEATLLARGGIMSSEQLLPLLQSYKDEELESVWSIISLAVGELRKFVEDAPAAEEKLRQLAANLASKQYERLGWNVISGESEEDTKLRAIVVGQTLYGEVPEALMMSQELYDRHKTEDLDPELRPLILGTVARYGDASIVDEMINAYKSTSSAELRQDICMGVTSTRLPDKITELLNLLKDPSVIRPQDSYRWFVYLVRGRYSRDLSWQWLRDNWDWVERSFAGDKSYEDFVRFASSALCTRQQLEEFKAFFEPKLSIPALSRAISVGISEIEGRVELIERDKDAVVAALLAIEN
ncbi:MAG: M1 family metallopeptidase [Candidatus Nomurabacteria bacterium]|nr:MAG: M1 family metallopeptidase [Candidatus Nomurabacteria bacterium]